MEQKEKIGFFSIGVNLLLVGIKGLLAYLSGSVALVADTIHSATDVISSITVFVGIKISKRRSKNFPYGLYKVENFVSLKGLKSANGFSKKASIRSIHPKDSKEKAPAMSFRMPAWM